MVAVSSRAAQGATCQVQVRTLEQDEPSLQPGRVVEVHAGNHVRFPVAHRNATQCLDLANDQHPADRVPNTPRLVDDRLLEGISPLGR